MKIQVIACDKSGYPAIIKYISSYPSDHEFTCITKVPCLGGVKESDLFEILESDCDRLLLVGCPLDSCHNLEGSRFAQRRVLKVNRLLEEADIPKMIHLSFVTVDKIAELKRTLDMIQPTPVHEEPKK